MHAIVGISQYLFSDQALRIKTKSYAAGSKVTNITYSVNIPLSLSQKLFLINIKGNYATGVREFGILIDQAGFQRIYYWCARVDLFFFLIQSYPKVLGKPGKGVIVSVGLRALSQSLAT